MEESVALIRNPWRFEPDGWLHEDSDPDVGIFGDAWFHEACPPKAEEFEEADVFEVNSWRTGSMTIDTHYRLACLDCGEVVDYVVEDFSPDDEWWAENQEAELDQADQKRLDSLYKLYYGGLRQPEETS